MTKILHVAGKPYNAHQDCVLCGVILIDHRTVAVPAAAGWWAVGAPITATNMSMLIGRDPDAVPCVEFVGEKA